CSSPVAAARGTPRTPFFEGCSPSPLAPSYASAAAADLPGAKDVGVASASAKHLSGKGKGGTSGGGGSGGGGGGSSGGGGGSRGGGSGGRHGGGGSGGSGSSGTGGNRTQAQREGARGGQRQQQQCWSEAQSPQQLRKWLFQRGASGSSGSCPYVIRTDDCAGQTCGRFHTQHRCFSRLDNAWRAEFGDEVERPRWAELLRPLHQHYRCVPPDPGIMAAALGASESSLPGTAPGKALHTFTLDSGASRCFFRDITTLTPLSAPVWVRQADPSGGLVVARSSTVLSYLAPVSICTCTRTGRYLATFTHRPGSSLYTLVTESPQHHRLRHPSLPRLRGMHSRLLVSGLPKPLSPLPPSLAPHCLPCIEGRQRAAPHSSFPPMTAPLQNLHMNMLSSARFNGQGRKRYFLLVVDDYTLTPRSSPCAARKRLGHDLPILRLHSYRGGEFSSDLLRDFCRGEGITQSFTLPASPQLNGIAERRIGLVMEVARTSMIHAATPHFLYPFTARFSAHQLNLRPRVSLPKTSHTLRWTGEVGDALVFRVWGSHAFVRDSSANNLSARPIPCVFLGFPCDAPGWQFYHHTSCHILSVKSNERE
ncbi:unnamed protein product, partial [Closterium sp. NIES-53]